ncbi:MAG: glycosyltransferase family 4 protein [Planctomycetes bacterium]|nr:glycosyltransferase family 4 protein [Planctomycetota bacterium]
MRLLLFGNFPSCPGYTRNRVLLRALEASGIECVPAHAPLFEDAQSRKAAASSPLRLIGLGARAARSARDLRRRYRAAIEGCDLVFVGYGGIGDQALARRLDREHRLPLVADAFLSLYETAVLDRRLCSEGSLRARWLRRIDRQVAERADLALVDTTSTARFLSELTGLELSRWSALPVGSELRRQDPAAPSDVLRGLFVGTGIPLHGTGVLLRAIQIVERSGQPFELVFVGGTAGDRELARELALRSVRFVDRFVGPLELEALHAASDFACGIFDSGPKAARVVPCKVYDALAAGRMVVTAETPAALELLGRSSALSYVPAGSPEALAAALIALRGRDLVSAGAAAHELFEARFSIARIGEELRERFAALLARGTHAQSA